MQTICRFFDAIGKVQTIRSLTGKVGKRKTFDVPSVTAEPLRILNAQSRGLRFHATTTPVDECRGVCSRFGYRHSHAVCIGLHQPISNGMNARLEMIGF